MNQSNFRTGNFIGLNSCQLNCPTIARASPCMLFIVNALDLYCSAPARMPSANFSIMAEKDALLRTANTASSQIGQF